MHLRHTPLHDIAELRVVDVEVLPPDRPLRALLQLVLPMTVPSVSPQADHNEREHVHSKQLVVLEHDRDFVQLLQLQPHPPGQVVIFETAGSKANAQRRVYRVSHRIQDRHRALARVLTPGAARAGPSRPCTLARRRPAGHVAPEDVGFLGPLSTMMTFRPRGLMRADEGVS